MGITFKKLDSNSSFSHIFINTTHISQNLLFFLRHHIVGHHSVGVKYPFTIVFLKCHNYNHIVRLLFVFYIKSVYT